MPISSLLLIVLSANAAGQVYTYECDRLPLDAGWTEVDRFCDPEERIDDGHLIHHVIICQNPPAGQQIFYSRSITEFEGVEPFFLEFRMMTDGPQSEIPFSAPADMAAGSLGPTRYNYVISRDLVNFIRDNRLPIVWADIEPGVPHVYRLELYGTSTYRLFIDGEIIDEGVPEGPYPSFVPEVIFGARARNFPNTTEWDYIRYGRIAEDGSGDFDSDGDIDLFDVHYFVECLDQSGPTTSSGPGCRWADLNGDADADLRDFSKLQNQFTAAP